MRHNRHRQHDQERVALRQDLDFLTLFLDTGRIKLQEDYESGAARSHG